MPGSLRRTRGLVVLSRRQPIVLYIVVLVHPSHACDASGCFANLPVALAMRRRRGRRCTAHCHWHVAFTAVEN